MRRSLSVKKENISKNELVIIENINNDKSIKKMNDNNDVHNQIIDELPIKVEIENNDVVADVQNQVDELFPSTFFDCFQCIWHHFHLNYSFSVVF